MKTLALLLSVATMAAAQRYNLPNGFISFGRNPALIHSHPEPIVHHPHPTAFQPHVIPSPKPTFHSQPTPTFHSQPTPTFHSQPTPTFHSQPQPTFHSQPQPTFHSQLQPTFHSQPQPTFHSQPTSNQPKGNHEFEGNSYLLSWKEGQNSFTHSDASAYCSGKGMKMISLDNPTKIQHFFNLLANENIEYFWAGGNISRDKQSLTWENGNHERIVKGQFPWSDKGRNGPQPDGVNSEYCLAIFKNVYNDGIKFHDVGCHFKKPTICEA